jgi:hypothetical protein
MEVSGQLYSPADLPLKRSPGTHWIGGWVGPRTGLDDHGEEKILDPTGTRTLALRPARSKSLNRLSYPGSVKILYIYFKLLLILIDYKCHKYEAWGRERVELLDALLAYSSTLRMEATCSSETSVDFKPTTRRYISEGDILQVRAGLDISMVNWMMCLSMKIKRTETKR